MPLSLAVVVVGGIGGGCRDRLLVGWLLVGAFGAFEAFRQFRYVRSWKKGEKGGADLERDISGQHSQCGLS